MHRRPFRQSRQALYQIFTNGMVRATNRSTEVVGMYVTRDGHFGGESARDMVARSDARDERV